MKECMEMNGGGPFSLGPGQVTDDSELAFCLMWGLIQGNQAYQDKGQNVLDLDSIALFYKKWMKSRPFDIGIATTNALSPLIKESRSAAAAKKAA